MTSRQTRLGADLYYEELEKTIVSARFEFDFYGGGAENKNLPMLRHAYFKVNFGKYYFLAGQTSDIFSPLLPTTVNYTVLWNCGDIGYRHPQIQFGNNTNKGLEIVGALSRNISGDFDNDGNDDGEDSSLPTVQVRLSYVNPKINAGISGHYGKMEFSNMGNCDGCKSYSLNTHLSYSIMDKFLLKGEIFTGKTLNQYFGGIGQGFDTTNGKGIKSSGGWINASIEANPKMSFNIGLGVDQPQKDGGKVFPERNSNRSVFGNMFAKIAYNTTFALEISHWTTGYYNDEGKETDSSSLRIQASFIHSLRP